MPPTPASRKALTPAERRLIHNALSQMGLHTHEPLTAMGIRETRDHRRSFGHVDVPDEHHHPLRARAANEALDRAGVE